MEFFQKFIVFRGDRLPELMLHNLHNFSLSLPVTSQYICQFQIYGNVRDDYKILHMDPDRPNIFFMDRKIKSSLKIGLVKLEYIPSYHVSKLSATSTRSLPGCCPFWLVESASSARFLFWTRQQKICSVSIEKSMILFLHEVFTKTESRSWVAASQMRRAGFKVQDAKPG